MRPKLSICLTTYNRAALLDRTLETLAKQPRPPDELIVSDDCSTDRTAEIATKWKGAFREFVYRRNEWNLNMPGNLNATIAVASGEYIANLHDGDLYAPSLLEEWERALDAHPTAGFVFCGLACWPVRTSHGGGVLLFDVAPFTPGQEFFERHFLGRVGSIVWGTVMARRSAYEELLPFDPAFGFVSDVDMWMRMCAGYDVAYVDKPLIFLDHSPSAERVLGVFNWKPVETVRRIHQTNIERMFAGDAARIARETRRLEWMMQRFVAARLLGRVRRRDWSGLKQGLAIASRLESPLRWIGHALS